MRLRSRSKPVSKPKRGRSTRIARARRGKVVPDAPLTLQTECTLADAATLKSDLCARLSQVETVILDAGSVERIDTSSLQLLAAFVRDRRLAGRAVKWHAVSSAVDSAARLLGMDAMLSLTEAAP